MSQIVTAVITGAAILLGYKIIQKQSEAVRATAKAARPQAGRIQKDLGALVWDERAGVYRPRA